MYIAADTLDDLMHEVFQILLERSFNIETSRGTMSEVIGVMLCLKNPTARLSRTETKGKLFSALGEFFWYLSSTNKLDFIKYYIPHYKKEVDKEGDDYIYGGYGPRLFNMHNEYNQIKNVIKLLSSNQNSRRATIQLFDAADIQTRHKDIPCTCTLQFIARDNQLNMVTYMRSNDAFWGLPHDIFSFTMLQEIIARTLGIEVGEYNHAVGSLHLYEDKRRNAQDYVNEGYQSTKKNMPMMPPGDPWSSIKIVQEIEEKIRLSVELDLSTYNLHPYWNDICLMFKAFKLLKNKENLTSINDLLNQFSAPIYKIFIENRIAF